MTVDSIKLPDMTPNLTKQGRERFIARSPHATDDHLKALLRDKTADVIAQKKAFERLQARQKNLSLR